MFRLHRSQMQVGVNTSASGSLLTFNISSDSMDTSSDSDSDPDSDSNPSGSVPTPHPTVAPDPDVSGSSAPSGSHLTAPGNRTAPNAGPLCLALSWNPLPSASPAPDDDAASTPRSTPEAPSNLPRSTRVRKPPVEFWKLPKDRQPAPASSVPESSDEEPAGSDADTAVHLANCTANHALSEQVCFANLWQ